MNEDGRRFNPTHRRRSSPQWHVVPAAPPAPDGRAIEHDVRLGDWDPGIAQVPSPLTVPVHRRPGFVE